MRLDLIHLLSTDSWRALFASFGRPASLRGRDWDGAAIARALETEAPAPLDDALTTMGRLGTVEGRRAVLEAARDRSLSLGPLLDDAAPDLAAKLVSRAPKEPAIAAVVERAVLHVGRSLAPIPFRHFVAVGDAPARAFDAARFAKTFARVAGDLARGTVEPRARLTAVGLAVDVLRPDASLAALVRGTKGDLTRATLEPLVVDALRWNTARRRLSIATAERSLLPAYRAAFGDAVLADARAFPARAYCTLQPLLDRWQEALAVPLPANVRRARVIALMWDSGADGIVIERGRDVLASMRRRGVVLAGGRLLGATIRFELANVPVPVDAQIRVPYRVQIEPAGYAPEVEDALDALGITRRGTLTMDLWSLAPHEHPVHIWTDAIGHALVSSMRTRGLLVPGERRAVENPDDPDAARALIAFPLPGGDSWGVPAEDEDVVARTIARADLATLRLDALALARAIARDLALDGTPRHVDQRVGLVDIGSRALGAARVHVFLAMCALDPRGLADDLRRRAIPGHAVVLVPEGHSLGVGVAEVSVTLRGIAGPFHALLPAVVHALGLADHVEAPLAAPMGTRFTLDTHTKDLWLDGVLLSALAPAVKRFLAALVRARGERVATEALNEAINKHRGDDGAARQMKRKALVQMAESFTKAGVTAPDDLRVLIVTDKEGGYRIAASVFVR